MLKVNIFDMRIHDLIDVDQELVTITDGYNFTEGPIWDSKRQVFIFSDIPNSRLWQWSEKEGAVLLKEETNKGNGNCFDHLGRILTCEGTSSRVVRMEPDMSNYEVMASHYQGKQLNSPNDIVVHSSGMIYFTDPQFGRRPTRAGLYRPQELDFQGVYMLNPDSKDLFLATDEVANPNGLCFTLDEKQMIVADSPRDLLYIFDVMPDGTLGNKRVFAHDVPQGEGKPDGVKIDVEGNVCITGPGGVQVFDKYGAVLATFLMPGRAGNLCFGGEDMKTLFICAEDQICTLRVKVPGAKLKW